MKYQGFRSYKTEASARAAIKREGLHAMKFTIEQRGERYFPLFACELPEDRRELLDRGFNAFLDRQSKPAA